MITEDYVSREIAILLKEKGFHEPVRFEYHYYNTTPSFHRHLRDFNSQEYEGLQSEWYSAPTYQMALKWLRKAHNIYIYATPWYHEEENPLKKGEYNSILTGWGYDISNITTNTVIAESDEDNLYSTPEQACEAAIKYCLENLI